LQIGFNAVYVQPFEAFVKGFFGDPENHLLFAEFSTVLGNAYPSESNVN